MLQMEVPYCDGGWASVPRHRWQVKRRWLAPAARGRGTHMIEDCGRGRDETERRSGGNVAGGRTQRFLGDYYTFSYKKAELSRREDGKEHNSLHEPTYQ